MECIDDKVNPLGVKAEEILNDENNLYKFPFQFKYETLLVFPHIIRDVRFSIYLYSWYDFNKLIFDLWYIFIFDIKYIKF